MTDADLKKRAREMIRVEPAHDGKWAICFYGDEEGIAGSFCDMSSSERATAEKCAAFARSKLVALLVEVQEAAERKALLLLDRITAGEVEPTDNEPESICQIVERFVTLKADRDSWRRVAERLEREKSHGCMSPPEEGQPRLFVDQGVLKVDRPCKGEK